MINFITLIVKYFSFISLRSLNLPRGFFLSDIYMTDEEEEEKCNEEEVEEEKYEEEEEECPICTDPLQADLHR